MGRQIKSVDEQVKMYIEVDADAYLTKNELCAVGEPFKVSAARSRMDSINHKELAALLRKCRNRRVEVLAYLIENRDYNNCVSITCKEISERTKIAKQTVLDAVTVFMECGIMKRHNHILMFSPKFIHRANSKNNAFLERMYDTFESEGMQNVDTL